MSKEIDRLKSVSFAAITIAASAALSSCLKSNIEVSFIVNAATTSPQPRTGWDVNPPDDLLFPLLISPTLPLGPSITPTLDSTPIPTSTLDLTSTPTLDSTPILTLDSTSTPTAIETPLPYLHGGLDFSEPGPLSISFSIDDSKKLQQIFSDEIFLFLEDRGYADKAIHSYSTTRFTINTNSVVYGDTSEPISIVEQADFFRQNLSPGQNTVLVRNTGYSNTLIGIHSSYDRVSGMPLEMELIRIFLEGFREDTILDPEYINSRIDLLEGTIVSLRLNGQEAPFEIKTIVQMPHNMVKESYVHTGDLIDVLTQRESEFFPDIEIGNFEEIEYFKSNRGIIISFCGWGPQSASPDYRSDDYRFGYTRYFIFLQPVGETTETNVHDLSWFIAPTEREAIELAQAINYIPEYVSEHPSLMCGPLAIAISNELNNTYYKPRDFWLTTPGFIEYFFGDTTQNFIFEESISEFDFTEFKLEVGDFLYLSGGDYHHMLTITRIDNNGRVYAITNIRTDEGFIVEEMLMFDPDNTENGMFYKYGQPDQIHGRTGQRSFYVYRPLLR